jgi:hypothetical protein
MLNEETLTRMVRESKRAESGVRGVPQSSVPYLLPVSPQLND